MFLLFRELWKHISNRHKKQLWLVLLLMIFSSFLEVISIGMLLPFLSVITAPVETYNHEMIQPFLFTLGIESPDQLLLPLTIGFISAMAIAGVTRLFLLYSTIHISQSLGHSISSNIYRRTLYQSYDKHLNIKSSEAIDGILNKTNIAIGGVITPLLMITSSFFLSFGVITTLFLIDSELTSYVLIVLGVIYWVLGFYTHKRLLKNGKIVNKESTQVVKLLQEGLGGIRDIIIDRNQEFYCNLYKDSDILLRKSKANSKFISGSPRFLIEILGVALISVIAYFMSGDQDKAHLILPLLGVVALGSQRLIPAMQQMYSSISTIKSSFFLLENLIRLLNQPLPNNNLNQSKTEPIIFEKKIILKNVGFSYTSNTNTILSNVNIEIVKGKCIGIMGVTGSGKSTLLDIIMGLLVPTQGLLLVDGRPINKTNFRDWQRHIAHVPQNIYLSDSTIEENIAFGQPKSSINRDRVRLAAQKANISGTIESWPLAYQTSVGENGSHLSGGQRQRIGIARALYKNSDVIIFDEITSALDSDTEQFIINSILNLSAEITVIIVAHRLNTLKDCDEIIELSGNGTLKQV